MIELPALPATAGLCAELMKLMKLLRLGGCSLVGVVLLAGSKCRAVVATAYGGL